MIGIRRTGGAADCDAVGECGAVRGDTGSVVAGEACGATSACMGAAALVGGADAVGWTVAGEPAGV